VSWRDHQERVKKGIQINIPPCSPHLKMTLNKLQVSGRVLKFSQPKECALMVAPTVSPLLRILTYFQKTLLLFPFPRPCRRATPPWTPLGASRLGRLPSSEGYFRRFFIAFALQNPTDKQRVLRPPQVPVPVISFLFLCGFEFPCNLRILFPVQTRF